MSQSFGFDGLKEAMNTLKMNILKVVVIYKK